MAKPTIDHRGPEFAQMTRRILERLQLVFQTSGPVILFPSSGTGAWEAALVNTLSPGERVLAFETGQFATLWRDVAVRLGLEVVWVEGDWRHGIDPSVVQAELDEDSSRSIKAVLVVHNETSTGITSRVAQVRQAMAIPRCSWWTRSPR
jgi:alanine-glyoxylate transaminase/serine-glyoxylate transaminase/serine-pyruvate transaminase